MFIQIVLIVKNFTVIRNCKDLSQLLETGEFQGVTLKGSTPKMAYRDKTIDGFCSAIQDRFQTADKNVLNATKILNLPGSIELAGFMLK